MLMELLIWVAWVVTKISDYIFKIPAAALQPGFLFTALFSLVIQCSSLHVAGCESMVTG